jgi:hypothetical protein
MLRMCNLSIDTKKHMQISGDYTLKLDTSSQADYYVVFTLRSP